MIELLNTIAAIGTFVVIAATAIAALVQLRHLRANNQLEGLLDVVARLEEEIVNTWITESRHNVPILFADPAYIQSVVDRTFDRNVSWLKLGNRNERIGSLLKYKLIPEEPFLDVYSSIVIQAWEILLPIISLVRETWHQTIWENFEYMYVRAKAFNERHQMGNYPRGVPRAKVPAFSIPAARDHGPA